MVIGLSKLSAYLPFDMNEVGESRCVLASFIKGGSIFHQPLDAIPPNKRFYSGGGGSIRGYAHQLVGPLDSQSIPLGGKSLAEIGTEIRFKTTETIGFVSFIEGGAVTEGRTPEFTRNPLWGAGVGFRYYSLLGPVRVDVAFPLKRRKDLNGKFIDSAFQLYLSIGQAF
jgi:translocation and assembly module TamA